MKRTRQEAGLQGSRDCTVVNVALLRTRSAAFIAELRAPHKWPQSTGTPLACIVWAAVPALLMMFLTRKKRITSWPRRKPLLEQQLSHQRRCHRTNLLGQMM